jgi:hypothetical protein
MKTNRRFSLLTFPQLYDGAKLGLNIVVLPRNQNPLAPAIEQNATIPDAPPFAQAKLKFSAKVISGVAGFPDSLSAAATQALVTTAPTLAPDLFAALGKLFDIDTDSLGQSNKNLDGNADQRDVAVSPALSVQKYLPHTYRQAFNFATPRTRNASTDDTYACAVRNAAPVRTFKPSLNTISWGKVFAYALRQPVLATRLGMIYQTELADLDLAALFAQGGWLYVDLATDSDYKPHQQADDNFIAKYAARIPALTAGAVRQVFAPLLVPVLLKANAADPDPLPDGIYDELLIEAAEYDDGFAKIVHAFQPRSLNLLAEESDGAHPVKDVGIRLGWDDEQILIWYMRQLAIDPTVKDPDGRIDAPLGTFGYAVDAREVALPALDWEPLNGVRSRDPLIVPRDKSPGAETLTLGSFQGELPYQVYPAQLDGDRSKSYWLPMYFANWNGHNIVLPDQDAADIYQTNNPTVKPDPAKPDPTKPDPFPSETGTGVSGPAQNQLNRIFAADPIKTTLRYGKTYEFRVRMRDLSGGGVPNDRTIVPLNESPANVARCHFKRYVAPHQVRLAHLPQNQDLPSTLTDLEIRRPLLGYPAVVYTAKYADPVALLKQASQQMAGTEAFGIEDPDVDRVEVTVEVETLRMDNLLSVSGQDNYVFLYKTTRRFPAVNQEADYKSAMHIPLTYKDCKVLHVADELDLQADLGLADTIDNLTEIVLPTARTARLTMRAVCEKKADDGAYYGLVSDADPDRDTRHGRILQLKLYKESADETGLFVNAAAADKLRGIYLQPDPPPVLDGNPLTLLLGKDLAKPPTMIQRLAKELKLENTGLTLTGHKGERVQFGCSNRIRHTLSPEHSSLTFSANGDLMNHWLCCITLDLNRDWAWDALEDRSLIVSRTLRFTHDLAAETETAEIGDIEIRHTAALEALQGPQRDVTRVVFIDAVEPKNPRTRPPPNGTEPRFPDRIELSYTITPRFKTGHGGQNDGSQTLALRLPITTPPAQIPRIASVGIALSPYARNPAYSATEPRQRFLWIEFEEPVKDSQDAYFARVLAYAPDQLISDNHPDLLIAPEKPALPIDPELIRVIPPGASNDLAGLNAMQPMEKATDSDRHYLLLLPPGLHANAPEMFGFFTYEFRVGHFRLPVSGEMVWSTAQGRFGRPLEVTGVQHPAPTLTCAVNRDEEKLYVVAPYAVAVLNGANRTADPPRTELWCLLYAQVRQADGQDFRNILLDDKPLDWRVQIELDKQVDWLARYDRAQRLLLKEITVDSWKDDLQIAKFGHLFKLTDFSLMSRDGTRYGTAAWNNVEVAQLLQLYGLPANSPLSVLVVELLPVITRLSEHVSNLDRPSISTQVEARLAMMNAPPGAIAVGSVGLADTAAFRRGPSPLSEQLGERRILRTSPLTPVPVVC